MKRSSFLRFVSLAAVLAQGLGSAALRADNKDDLPSSEIARIGKESTAFVEVSPGRSASAFCVHPSGLFLTNNHVVQDQSGQIKVVVNSGTLEQKVLNARVVRRDKEMDLALLKVENGGDLPALAFGSASDLAELIDVVVFGFPFGRAPGGKMDQFPAISINRGAVNSLPRKDGKIDRIQLSAAVNPGNSGGPILNFRGKVLGVIVGRVEGHFGAGIDLAIPVNKVDAFLTRPEIEITPPASDEVGTGESIAIRASVTSLIPTRTPTELQLVLAAGTPRERRVPMVQSGPSFTARVVPFPASKVPVRVGVQVKFADGSVGGLADDGTIKVGSQALKLSQFRSLVLRPSPEARLADGRPAEGALDPPAEFTVHVGGQALKLDLTRASAIEVTDSEAAGAVSCSVVASLAGEEVGRVSSPVYLRGAARPSFDALREGRFLRPARSSSPVSSLRIESSQGDYIGQGKSYAYTKDELTFQPWANAVRCQVGSIGGFALVLSAGQGRTLEAVEYREAKRQPFSGTSPGIELSGNGRGCNTLSGEFRVWEIELKGNEVVRLAVDFVQRCEGKMPPLVGMLRYNSSFH